MSESSEKAFNLGEANPDPGAGLLYSLRYGAERLRGHQNAGIKALRKIGVAFEDIGEGMVAARTEITSDDTSQTARVMALCEELSCLNEALEYKDQGATWKSVIEVETVHLTAFYDFIRTGNIVDAYAIVSGAIPQIVSDLMTAHHQNKVLSPYDLGVLKRLQTFAEIKRRELEHPGGKVYFIV